MTALGPAGAREQPAFGGAPSADVGALGPASAENAADILFTNGATRAVLADDTLKLTGVTGVTLYSTSGSKAGVYTTGTANYLQALMLWASLHATGYPVMLGYTPEPNTIELLTASLLSVAAPLGLPADIRHSSCCQASVLQAKL